MALAKLVGRVEWVAGNAMLVERRCGRSARAGHRPGRCRRQVAETLRLSASLICDGEAHPVDDPAWSSGRGVRPDSWTELIDTELDAEVSTLIDRGSVRQVDGGPRRAGSRPGPSGGIAASLDPSFRARALGIATEMVADAALEAAGAQAVGDRRLGAATSRLPPCSRSRLISHLSFRSVWFRNAVRGAAGLALAVAVVEVTNVEHGFWVVLGTLVGAALQCPGHRRHRPARRRGDRGRLRGGLGHHDRRRRPPVLLWVLLPVAVLVSGVAPSMISFAAGQAGFTVVVIILFNIIDPTGWNVGLTRIEDVAIGCAVSVVVGLLFWPRGATAALGRALSDAFVESSGYLADAVDRLTITARQVDTGAGPAGLASAPTFASTMRSVSSSPSVGPRWSRSKPSPTSSPGRTGSDWRRTRWPPCRCFPPVRANPSSSRSPSPERSCATPMPPATAGTRSSPRCWPTAASRLTRRRSTTRSSTTHSWQAFEDARDRQRGDRLRDDLQMLWADELLETQRQVQADLADSAALFARRTQARLMI